MSEFSPFEASTITATIKAYQNTDLTHAKIHYKSSFNKEDGSKVILNYTSIVDKYYDYLQKIIVEVTLTDKEYAMYRYQPKRLSLDYYDTTELWSSILRINNMFSVTQFDKHKIKLFTQDIFDVINEILILEEDEMKNNHMDTYAK